MNLYYKAYVDVLKSEFMLLVIGVALLFFTFGLWAGFPLFIVGAVLADWNTPGNLILPIVFLLTGLLFSLYFVPIHLQVAKKVAKIKQQKTMFCFIKMQTGFMLSSASIYALIFTTIT